MVKREEIKKTLQKPRVTPIQFIIFMISVAWIVYTAEDKVEAIIYLSFQVSLILSGMSMGDIKAMLNFFKAVLKDPRLKLDEKLRRIIDYVIVGCAAAGEVQEEINILQGTDFRSEEQKLEVG